MSTPIAMSRPIHGWKVTHSIRPDGKPQVELSKPERNTVTSWGRRGVDPTIVLQRALIEALRQDVEVAGPQETAEARQRLHRAILDERVAMADRTLPPQITEYGVG